MLLLSFAKSAIPVCSKYIFDWQFYSFLFSGSDGIGDEKCILWCTCVLVSGQRSKYKIILIVFSNVVRDTDPSILRSVAIQWKHSNSWFLDISWIALLSTLSSTLGYSIFNFLVVGTEKTVFMLGTRVLHDLRGRFRNPENDVTEGIRKESVLIKLSHLIYRTVCIESIDGFIVPKSYFKSLLNSLWFSYRSNFRPS